MGPTLLLDKSAFQALTSSEMHKITKYFDWNRVVILYFEILGDYSKKAKTASFRNEVSILADKVSVIDSYQNEYHGTLCVANLLGDVVKIDGRPIVAPTTIRTLDDGQIAALTDETSFCEMIYRWQRGDFKKVDEYLANLWKNIKDNSKADLQCLTSNHIIIPKSTSIDELRVEIDKLLQNPNIQSVFLNIFLSYLDVDSTTKYAIKNRLKQCPYSLQKVAPYAFYCLRAFALFLGANKFNLITRRPTDRIDLEYLFYLPFCHVFSSNDKLHKKLSPILMRKDQVFLSGDDLKRGIQEIETLPKHTEFMNTICAPIPPMPKESIIRDVWIKTKWLYD